MKRIYDDFTKKIFEKVSSTEENVVVSPLSVLLLLGIAADAVKGDSRDEILKALDGCSYEDFRSKLCELQSVFSASETLVSSNAVCIKEELSTTITPGYEEKLADYGGKLFATKDIVSSVNEWVNEKTRGMISEIADESMNQMLACLMNAIAFEAEWDKQYEEDDIHEDEFTDADGKKSDIWMLESLEHSYIENDSFTGFIKPYKDREYSFMALLPKNPDAMEQALSNVDFAKMYSEAFYCKVYASIPEFKYDYSKELTAILMDMGIRTVFTPQADFSPMSSEWLRIDSILHKAHIDLDRKGTKAAAVTMAFVTAGCAQITERSEEVRLDRPFLYAIMHNESGLPVFTGIMNKAQK